MPNIKSAIKRVKVTKAKTLQNSMIKSELKTVIRKSKEGIASGNVEAAEKLVREAISKIDKAVAKGVIHKNTAARKKSKLVKKLLAAKN